MFIAHREKGTLEAGASLIAETQSFMSDPCDQEKQVLGAVAKAGAFEMREVYGMKRKGRKSVSLLV